MKLNIGCGTYPFPFDRNNIPRPEHFGNLPDIAFEPGWINIDKKQSAGVQEKINLFKFPWIRSSNGCEFNDDSADLIWAAHILEHVPHEVGTHTANLPLYLQTRYRKLCEDYDGFFVFLYECWRILKPDGLLYLREPFATCYSSLSDPTHTRYLTPGSFSYVGARADDTPFDYEAPCHFELAQPIIWRLQGEWVEKARDYTPEGFLHLSQNNYFISDEFQIVLRAVKE